MVRVRGRERARGEKRERERDPLVRKNKLPIKFVVSWRRVGFDVLVVYRTARAG